MTTKVTTTFDADPDYAKIITVNHGNITINEWAEKNLTPEENAEWLRQDKIHEEAVHAAVAAGDCFLDQQDKFNAAIKWKSETIHQKWMDTIPPADHEIYKMFWTRYLAYLDNLKQGSP